MRSTLIPLAFCLAPLAGHAADTAPPEPYVIAESGWSFRITPYGWLPAMHGTQTVKGRSADVDASFIDILNKSDTLVGLMADFEARNGRWSLMADLVWNRVGLSQSMSKTQSTADAISGTIGASLGLDVRMAIVELGATYELARSGGLSFDLLAGGRYWNQKADLSLDLTTTTTVDDLEITSGKAIAHSGTVAWTDPFVGARLRYAIAPGHAFTLRGDVGGFGVGSRMSWQAIGAYGFDIGVRSGTIWSGVIGYRALYVDYAKGSGNTRYEFDMLQHGPIIGLSARF